MPKLEIFDETFDPDRLQSYELSIQVSLNGFSFCIKDVVRGMFVALVSVPLEGGAHQNGDWHPTVSMLHKAYQWLGGDFHRVTFCFESFIYTFVPDTLFEPRRAKQFVDLVHVCDELDELRFNKLPDGTICVFAIPSMLAGEWLKVNPKTRFISYCQPLLAYNGLSSNGSDPTISILASVRLVTFAISTQAKILHASSQPIDSPEDAVYHALSISKALNLNPTGSVVHLMGGGDLKEQYEFTIRRFFADVKPYKSPSIFHYSYLLTRYKLRFADLFMQSICE